MSQGWQQSTGGQDADVRHRHSAGEESLNSAPAARPAFGSFTRGFVASGYAAIVLSVGLYLIAVSWCHGQAAVTLPAKKTAKWLRPLLDAMREVESGGDPDQVGDGGRSFGPYQIKREYWIDSRIPGSFRQVRDRGYAEQVMLAYWQRHCPQALVTGNYQILARVHNGGPTGDRKPETMRYWIKVKKKLSARDRPSQKSKAGMRCMQS